MIEVVGILRHIQRYLSQNCDGTDVQADWRSCTYGRAPYAIDPREDAGGLSREYVLRIPSVS